MCGAAVTLTQVIEAMRSPIHSVNQATQDGWQHFADHIQRIAGVQVPLIVHQPSKLIYTCIWCILQPALWRFMIRCDQRHLHVQGLCTWSLDICAMLLSGPMSVTCGRDQAVLLLQGRMSEMLPLWEVILGCAAHMLWSRMWLLFCWAWAAKFAWPPKLLRTGMSHNSLSIVPCPIALSFRCQGPGLLLAHIIVQLNLACCLLQDAHFCPLRPLVQLQVCSSSATCMICHAITCSSNA